MRKRPDIIMAYNQKLESTEKQIWWRKRNWTKFLLRGIIGAIELLIHERSGYLTVAEIEYLDKAKVHLETIDWAWESGNVILKDVHSV